MIRGAVHLAHHRPRWRWWAHRLGLIPSPTLNLLCVPFGRQR